MILARKTSCDVNFHQLETSKTKKSSCQQKNGTLCFPGRVKIERQLGINIFYCTHFFYRTHFFYQVAKSCRFFLIIKVSLSNIIVAVFVQLSQDYLEILAEISSNSTFEQLSKNIMNNPTTIHGPH